MPSVMYLKYLKIIRKMPGSQVRIWKAHCDDPKHPSARTADVRMFTFMAVTTATSFVPEKMVESGVLS